MLEAEAARRPTVEAVLGCPYFTTGPVDTLRQLESLMQLDAEQQAGFLRHLPSRLAPFPPLLLRDFVLPPLRALLVNKVRAAVGWRRADALCAMQCTMASDRPRRRHARSEPPPMARCSPSPQSLFRRCSTSPRPCQSETSALWLHLCWSRSYSQACPMQSAARWWRLCPCSYSRCGPRACATNGVAIASLIVLLIAAGCCIMTCTHV